ncbi:MAG: DNA polymerase III subunit chi [Planktotalea sp.]|uniref:DNA polymerase III subunit chi n=1 Tax=Planktotalea sp. TaxID=2029877 RepID=UPI003C76DDC4
MGAAFFYHLTRQPLETTLPLLLGKARGAGWRCLVVGPNVARLEALDARLWHGNAADFLAHGLAGGPHDADQPILLSSQFCDTNKPACIMCIDGADITAAHVQNSERTCILFDGNDAAATQSARVQWKTLTDAGCSAQYWSEESGSWQMKAKKD